MYVMIVDKDGNPIEQSNPLKIQMANIPDVMFVGQPAIKITAGGAGDVTAHVGYGKIWGVSIKQTGITVILKDGANEVWNCSANMPNPIICETSVVLNFSAAGDAFLIYNW